MSRIFKGIYTLSKTVRARIKCVSYLLYDSVPAVSKAKVYIRAAHAIREMDRSVLLIYVSGYEQYLKELFEV